MDNNKLNNVFGNVLSKLDPNNNLQIIKTNGLFTIKNEPSSNSTSSNSPSSNPTSSNIGFATYTAIDPVTENTIKIIMNWKFDVIPHFSFNLFMMQN